MKKKTTVFPNPATHRPVAMSQTDIKLNGMKVIFDRTAMLVPTELVRKKQRKIENRG